MVVVGNPCFNIVVVVILLVGICDVIKLSRILEDFFLIYVSPPLFYFLSLFENY